VHGEKELKSQATALFPLTLSPVFTAYLTHFEGTLQTTLLTADTRHCTSTAAVICVTKYALSG